ncbi:MAG: Maf family nucleotide pyrophosphatase [Bacteroidales bacterium]|nr:Maf family nucleotide pyrophosphatase [Bacteroidales bacterium]
MSANTERRIILGSASPRRRELLAGLDVEFTVDTGNSFIENIDPSVEAHKLPVMMAEGKSDGFHRELEDDELLITADTVVIFPETGEVLGKPHSRNEAVEMIRKLSGRTHEVLTAVTFRTPGGRTTITDSTLVTFRKLNGDEISYYVDRYRPYDKAGAYGVQEWIGYVAIERIEGSFYNVMGFPVHKVYEMIFSNKNQYKTH